MSSVQPIPGKPGHFVDRNGEVTVLTEAYETDRYDTEEQTSGAISAGDTMTYFKNLNNKDDLDANIPEANKLVTGAERFVLESIGVGVQASNSTLILTSADLKRFICHGFLEVKLNRNEIESGPVEKYPSGYGPAGQTSENAAGIYGLGMASRAAVRPLKEQQLITRDHTIKGTITFQSRSWLNTSALPTLDNDVVARLYMHGILESAATNN